MFTFGRSHEVSVALRRHGGPGEADTVVAVVEAVHDLLEGKVELPAVLEVIRGAIVEGRRDVWDAAGTWLLKLEKDYPRSVDLWHELAAHPRAEVRFRVAGHIVYMRKPLRTEIYEVLKNDRSKRVRELSDGKWDFCEHPEKYA